MRSKVISNVKAFRWQQWLVVAMFSGVFYLRAKTEERHLSLDPVYVQYAQWIDEHGMFRWLDQVPFARRLVQWKLTF